MLTFLLIISREFHLCIFVSVFDPAELLQLQEDEEERVVAYGSYALTPEQRKYCTTRKELLNVVRFTRQYRHYLLGRLFTVRTDHASLVWLMQFKEPQGQLARWMEELSQYNIILRHRAGRKHIHADALSRMPAEEEYCGAFSAGVRPEDLLVVAAGTGLLFDSQGQLAAESEAQGDAMVGVAWSYRELRVRAILTHII